MVDGPSSTHGRSIAPAISPWQLGVMASPMSCSSATTIVSSGSPTRRARVAHCKLCSYMSMWFPMKQPRFATRIAMTRFITASGEHVRLKAAVCRSRSAGVASVMTVYAAMASGSCVGRR